MVERDANRRAGEAQSSPGSYDRRLHTVSSARSRSLSGVGSVLRMAAQALVENARPLAACALGIDQSKLTFARGEFRVRGGRLGIALERVIAAGFDKNPHPLNVRMAAKFGGNYPNGCHVAEVQIDPQTGAISVVRYTAVDDCGTVINPTVVEGQIVGGVVQGLGQSLLEHATFDPDSGQLQTGSFMDYALQRAGVVRLFDVIEQAKR